MNSKLMTVSLLLATMSLVGNTYAADGTATTTAKPKTRSGLKAAQELHDRQQKRDEKRKAAAAIKAVDINNASLDDLKKLPGVGDKEATQIIAGRPYGSKAWLVTHNIINPAVYASINKKIVAGASVDKAPAIAGR